MRKIIDEFYRPMPDGLIGNEDCGQMSAWYVLSAGGFYPVSPGLPLYDIGTPLFPDVKFHLENGKIFNIRAKNLSERNIYVKSVRLNGKTLKSAKISHADIMKGGVLEFVMDERPHPQAIISGGTKQIASPAVPSIEAPRVFSDYTTVTINSATKDAEIRYTLDGSVPSVDSELYTAPFRIYDSLLIKATAFLAGDKSLPAEAKINRRPNDWTVEIKYKYNRQYTGGGDDALIDGIRGTINFAGGEWQGYQPFDLFATIDLKKPTEIHELGGGFLQNARSWIWMPKRIEFDLSMDGVNWTRAAEITPDVKPDDMREQIWDFTYKITPTVARFVRVRAVNPGKIPEWHPGAGNDAFIFVDEIIIK